MKNKKAKLGILVFAAVVLFTATAFAAAPSNEGYEALKQIMKDSKTFETNNNITLDGSFQLSDNGKAVTEFAGVYKGNHDGKEASGNMQINMMGKAQDLTVYKSADAVYLVDENNAKYYQFTNMDKDMDTRNDYSSGKERFGKDYTAKHEMNNTGEALLDYFVGDLKSQFELSQNSDGGKSITLDLNQNEIPVPLNLMAGLAVENKSGQFDASYESGMNPIKKAQLIEKMPFLKDFLDMKKIIPELKEDVKLTGIYTKLNFDANNQIKSFDAKMSITGRDKNGVLHDITFTGSARITNINNTVVDKFNPDGKNIEIIDCREFENKTNN